MDLSKIKTELQDIETFLAHPDAYNNPDFAAKSKRASLLHEIVDLDAKITQDEENLKEAEELVNDPNLPESDAIIATIELHHKEDELGISVYYTTEEVLEAIFGKVKLA